ncbi:MAG: Fe-S cluster assembly protein SufD [Duncaniella sp.]|nr:Fe-S cluster assembly protein SufD [Duncaniella sp.]MDE7144782.1 Fe-S cluster assembly protein SufD [Duncaniella sp.]
MDNALNQYINLYKENTKLIDDNSAPVLNALRPDALQSLDGAHLPTRHTEGFEKTSIEEMFAPDYGVNISRVNIPVDVTDTFRCDVPNLSTLLGFVINDSFHPASKLESKLPEGVIFTSLRKAAAEHPELVERYYGSVAPLGDTSVALNTLLVQDGVFIYVPRNIRLERPLQLVNIFSAPVPMMAFRRGLIVLEEGAELQLLVCDHTQQSDNDFLGSQVVEVIAGERARFETCTIEESSERTSRYSKMFIRQHAHSQVICNATTLTCGNTRNEFTIDLLGEHCETHLAGMAIGSGKMHIDNDSAINHRAPHCHSNQLFKYVLDEESTGAFEGSILVTPQAQYTEAYQSNRNILASTSARMHCKPQLEIYNDEVKCSHGATTGQLDNDALFYMRTRGIPESEARTMLMQAFMIDVIETVRIPGLQERLRHLVERRFSGTLGDCSACKEKC